MSATPEKPRSLESAESATPQVTVFRRPCHSITVQRSTLCVSVSAQPDTPRDCPHARG